MHQAFAVTAPLARDVKMPKFMFFWGRERHDNDFLFLFLNFDTVLKNSTPEKITNIWRIERDRRSAIKFEAARIRFLIIWRFRSCRRCCCLSCLVYGDVALLRYLVLVSWYLAWPEMADIFPLIIHQKRLCGSHRQALLLRRGFCQVELSGSGFKRRSRG